MAQGKKQSGGLEKAAPYLRRIADMPEEQLPETATIRRFAYLGIGDLELKNGDEESARAYYAKATFGPTRGSDLSWTIQRRGITAPEYPEAALKASIQGWVRLDFAIDEFGSPQDIQLVGSYPPHVFDEAARQAVKKAKFYPKPPIEVLQKIRNQFIFTFELHE